MAKRLCLLFALDLRSLALFRICLGLVVLTDLGLRAADLDAHYTDWGVLPRDAVADAAWSPWRFSVYFAVGDAACVAGLFLLQATLAVLLIAGVRTRLVTALSWIMLVSLHNRNTLVLNAGDTLLRLQLFWGMFLPLGARFAFDVRRRAPLADGHNAFVSTATVAFIVQLCAVYWFAAALKRSPSWWDGSALRYALHMDLMTKPAGLWLRDIDWLLPPLTHASVRWEWIGPLLLFVPFRTEAFRLIAIGGFFAFHLGIYVLLQVGIFPLVCLCAWTALLPGSVWNWCSPSPQHGKSYHLHPDPGTAGTGELRRGRGVLAAFFIVYVLAWNVRTLDFVRYVRYFPRRWNVLAEFLRLDQHWNMFAPGPPTQDGWFVVPATLVDGREVDLFTDGGPVVWDKPAMVSATIPNRRWGKYLMRLRSPKYAHRRQGYAAYLARRWHSAHGDADALRALGIYFVREDTLTNRIAQPRRVRLLHVEAIGSPVHQAPSGR